MERKKYSLEKGADKKLIWDGPFLERLRSFEEEEEKIRIIQLGIESRPYILYVSPGLTAEIQEDTYPVIVTGESASFEEGLLTLESLMCYKLEESN